MADIGANSSSAGNVEQSKLLNSRVELEEQRHGLTDASAGTKDSDLEAADRGVGSSGYTARKDSGKHV